MDVVTYTGTGASRNITGLNFSPDFVWIKERGAAGGHNSYDIVRGASVYLASESINGEGTDTDALTAFNSDGFSLGSGYTVKSANGSGRSYVGWCWDAGASTVSNISGSVSSQVRANVSAGFSVCTFTSASSGACSFGHGLNVTPGFVIVKGRASGNWLCQHISTGTQYTKLNSTDAAISDSLVWNSAFTSSIVNIGSGFAGSVNYVAYCFSPVVGYSSFGSYTGNGSSDGPFVYTGFRPRWVMIKRSDSTSNWFLVDTARDTYNVSGLTLFPNTSDSEQDLRSSSTPLDILSNGFKLRTSTLTGGTNINISSATYIYAAFAEAPLQFARAR
jgi:hypothetical protein